MKSTTLLQLVFLSQIAWLISLSVCGINRPEFNKVRQIEKLSSHGSSYPALSIDQVVAIQKDPTVILVDARSKEQYISEHIPSAISLPLQSELTPGVEKVLRSAQHIVVYCSGKNCDSSELVANRLSELGFQNISILTDGWRGWQDRGLPVKMGEAP